MRRLLPVLLLSAAALATPALALTISPQPTRDQAPHLKQERSSTGNTDLRESLAADGRPLGGGTSYSSGATYGQTQTFGFGSVTTTVTTGQAYVPGAGFGSRPTYSNAGQPAQNSQLLGPRRY